LAALALLSPTSSIAPLAEMVNEHRPYLPLGILSTIAVLALGVWLLRALEQRPRYFAGVAVAMLLVSLFALTWERNRAFSTKEAYYADVLKKSPSARAYMNYGLILRGKGKQEEAMEHYRQALRLAPHWHLLHINMALVHSDQGNTDLARRHFDQAVALDRYSNTALEYRGRFHLTQRAYAAAAADLLEAKRQCRDCFEVHRGLATAFAGLADSERSLQYVEMCLSADPRRAEEAIASISAPFWESQAGQEAGIVFYREVDRRLPGRWWVQLNLATLLDQLGRSAEAAKHRQRAVQLRGEQQ